LAAQADADLLLLARDVPVELSRDAPLPILGLPATSAAPLRCAVREGLALTVAGDAFRDPRALVAARLRGYDFVVWHAREDGEWTERFARTRALELRVYVVAFAGGRAFAVDPEGTVIAGTFERYRLAAFVYERARTHATAVAPGSDILEGLRNADAIRARATPRA
ncbi:MAG: hypothetical protein ACREM2_07395, partial [Vulcanimicrobiaceae bacterium]